LHQWVTSYQKPSRSAAAAATASSGTSNAARFRATPKEILARICEVYQVIFFCLEIRKRTDKFLRLCDAKFAEAELREADLMVEVLKKETEMLVRKDADEEDSKRATAALRGFRA